MKANKRKTGGAYRRQKQMISLLCSGGKDRSKVKRQLPSKEIEQRVKERGERYGQKAER